MHNDLYIDGDVVGCKTPAQSPTHLIPVHAHSGQQEGGRGEGDDLHVDDDLAGSGAQSPVPEGQEKDLGGVGKDGHSQVPNRQVDQEHVDTLDAP